MKHLLALGLVAVFSSGAVYAGDDDKKEIEIANYDQNDDGLLSREEIASNAEISAQFEKLDANADGQLGEDELDSGPIDDFDEIGEDPVDKDW